VYDEYPAGAVTDPAGPEQNANASRVLRGGAWNNNPDNCRSAYRNNNAPDNRNNNIGFRLALHFRDAGHCPGADARNRRAHGPGGRGVESPGPVPAPPRMIPRRGQTHAVRPGGSGRSNPTVPPGLFGFVRLAPSGRHSFGPGHWRRFAPPRKPGKAGISSIIFAPRGVGRQRDLARAPRRLRPARTAGTPVRVSP